MYSSVQLSKWQSSSFRFLIEECGADGDCMFHVLRAALNNAVGTKLTTANLRQVLASTITVDNVGSFIESVSEDQSKKIFTGSVSMSDIKSDNKSNLASMIRTLILTPGWCFPGTDVVLRWLHKHSVVFARIGFIVYSSFGPGYTTVIRKNADDIFFLLFNQPNKHWQLVHIVRGSGLTCFACQNVLSILAPYM